MKKTYITRILKVSSLSKNKIAIYFLKSDLKALTEVFIVYELSFNQRENWPKDTFSKILVLESKLVNWLIV